MADKGGHDIRNGTIATVAGGILLLMVDWVRNAAWDVLLWLWGAVVAGYAWLGRDYAVPVWALVIVIPLALATVVRFASGLKPRKESGPTFLDYTKDNIYGAVWRWRWANNHITNLCCFCPMCDSQLAFRENDAFFSRYDPVAPPVSTEFICEHCGSQTRAKIAGLKYDAVARVEGEILRRLRIGERP